MADVISSSSITESIPRHALEQMPLCPAELVLFSAGYCSRRGENRKIIPASEKLAVLAGKVLADRPYARRRLKGVGADLSSSGIASDTPLRLELCRGGCNTWVESGTRRGIRRIWVVTHEVAIVGQKYLP